MVRPLIGNNLTEKIIMNWYSIDKMNKQKHMN